MEPPIMVGKFTSTMANQKATSARSRGWLWFFIALALLSATAICVQLWYNPTVPLTPTLLADAEAKWKQHGPHDYDLDYTIKKIESTERFQVKVRNGKAISVIMNGNLALESRLYPWHTMPALYGFIDEFMEQDTQPGSPRTFTNVLFDPVDGHLIHYVRSVASKRQRVEIIVRLTPLPVSPVGT
jgi:Family of unknown function (DUF6174)